jgi:hypothetical protein
MAETDNPQVIRVSSKAFHTRYINRAKEVLSDFETCELHGLGESTVNCVRAADSLVRLGYATVDSFLTDTVQERTRTYKAIITLRKTADFERIKQEFEKSRQDAGEDMLAKS